jgi:Secretion system C-terminal sorting domain/Periplasmic copper-binding protein (NosD)
MCVHCYGGGGILLLLLSSMVGRAQNCDASSFTVDDTTNACFITFESSLCTPQWEHRWEVVDGLNNVVYVIPTSGFSITQCSFIFNKPSFAGLSNPYTFRHLQREVGQTYIDTCLAEINIDACDQPVCDTARFSVVDIDHCRVKLKAAAACNSTVYQRWIITSNATTPISLPANGTFSNLTFFCSPSFLIPQNIVTPTNFTITHIVRINTPNGFRFDTCSRNIVLSPCRACDGVTIEYTFECDRDPMLDITDVTFDGNCTFLSWDFGTTPATTSTVLTPKFNYSANGMYVVTLNYECNGNTLHCSFPVNVGCIDTIVPEFDCHGARYCFDSRATNNEIVSWVFSDGISISGRANDPINIPLSYTIGTFGAPCHYFTNYNTYNGDLLRATYTINGVSTMLTITPTIPGIFIGRENTTTLFSNLPSSLISPSYGNSTNERIYIFGELVLDGAITTVYSFSGGDLHFSENSGLTLDNNIYMGSIGSTFTSLTDSCCLWRGIECRDKSYFYAESSNFINAKYAVRPISSGNNLPEFELYSNHFINNYIGIRATNNDFILWSFVNNTFMAPNLLNCSFTTDMPWYPIGTQGFTGILTSNLNDFNLPYTSYNNIFSQSANGIWMENTSANITTVNCESNISDNIYLGQGGRGIMNNHGVRNYTNMEVSNSNFNNCETGIQTLTQEGSIDVNIHDNKMTNVQRGIESSGDRGEIANRIVHNSIDANSVFNMNGDVGRYGIAILDANAAKGNHLVYLNRISLNYPDVNQLGYGIWINGPDFGTNPPTQATPTLGVQANINENFIDGTSNSLNKRGIWVNQYANCNLIDNNVALGTEPDSRGIDLFYGVQEYLECNTISQANRGVSTLATGNTSIGNNSIINSAESMYFEGSCLPNTNVSCNNMLGNQVHGIHYMDNAMTGWQIDKGNQFYGTYSGLEARQDGGLDRYLSKKVSPFFPNTQSPNFFQSSPITPTCYECEKRMIGRIGGPKPANLLADAILQKMMPGDRDIYIFQLYNSMLQDPMSIDPADHDRLTSYYLKSSIGMFDAMLEPLGQLSTLPEYKWINDDQDLLQQIYKDLKSNNRNRDNKEVFKANHIKLLNKLADKNEIYAEKVKKLSEILNSTWRQYQSVLDNIINTNKDSKIEDIRTVLSMYLKSKTQVLEDKDLEVLQNIGTKCATEYGYSVYIASALYTNITHLELDWNRCTKSNTRQAKADEDNPSKYDVFSIQPNPASNTVNLNGLDNTLTYTLHISDISGRDIVSFDSYNSNRPVDVSTLQSGLYIIKITLTNGQLLNPQKLIIER